MLSLLLVAGIWSTSCIQTQINTTSGYAIETYNIAENGNYQFKREWYGDINCDNKQAEEIESGTVTVGKKLSGMFVTGETYEADFVTSAGKDLGAVQVNEKSLKVARGLKINSPMRNTMVGVFEYLKR